MRRGFTLIEVVIATAIAVLIGAVIYATLVGSRDRANVEASHDVLVELAATLHRYDTLIGGVGGAAIGRYPHQLYHLTNPITNVGTANCPNCRTSCGLGQTNATSHVYSLSNVTAWNATGPFYSRDIRLGVGFPIPIGLVRDTLVRIPTASASLALAASDPGLLQIQIDSVLTQNARDLKEMVDSGRDSTVGTVRWSGPPDAATDTRTVFWTMPVRGC